MPPTHPPTCSNLPPPASWLCLQESAGTYAYLRDSACLKVEQPRPFDLTPEAASMLERLMLAQAQVGGAGGRVCGRVGGRVPAAAKEEWSVGLYCIGSHFNQERTRGACWLADLAACLPPRSPCLLCCLSVQECVLEKAINDRKTPGIIARVAKQAAVYYRECASLLSAAPLSQVGG